MIKKTGLLLAIAMTAALVPISANAAPYSGYPYLYEDFEDKTADCISWDNVSYYGISESGYAKSKACLKVTLGGNGQLVRIPVSLSGGTKYRLSCYVMPEGDVQTDELDFIFWLNQKLSDGSAGKEGYRRAAVKNLTFTDGKWTKVSTEFYFDGTAALNGADVEVLGDGKVSLRFGSNGSLSEINGKSSFTYYVDDLCIEPIFEPSAVPDKEPFDNGGLLLGGSFEGKKLNDAWECDNVTAEIISGGADGTSHAVSVTGGGKLMQKVPIAYSHTYFVSGYLKGESGEASLVIDRTESGGTAERYPIGTLTDDWQRFDISVYQNPTGEYTDAQPQLYIEADGGYVLDEISLTSEKTLVHNGDFGEDLDSYWLANGDAAAISLSDDVPGGDCGAQRSLVTAQSSARKDWAYQYISVKPKTEYKLSFWAKGIGCKNGNDITNYEIMPVFQNAYSGDKFQIKDDSLKFDTEWKFYEINYTSPADIENSVQLYFRSSNNFVAMEFLLTDIKLTEANGEGSGSESGEKTYTTPEIRNLETNGYVIKNGEISINAEYLGPNPQTGLIQLFKQAEDGGWASIETAEFNGEPLAYTFSADDIGQNVKVRIVPMDTLGNVGGYREEVLGKVFDSFEIDAEFTSTPQASDITAQASVANWSGEDKSIVCMLLLYDEKNACIASAYTAAETSFGSRETLYVSLPNTSDCKTARLFVWEGTSDVDTTMISLKSSVLFENR